jgi:hypothetical protein
MRAPELRKPRRRFPAGSHALIVATFILIGVCGCLPKTFITRPEFANTYGSPRVLLMPVDIELFEVTAAGMLEPKAEWTENARANLEEALPHLLAGHDAALVRYQPSQDQTELGYTHTQLAKLHAVVGQSIVQNTGAAQALLPTMKDRFDWSLGTEASVLGASQDADYALFIHIRDAYESAGRFVVMLAVVAMGGQPPVAVKAGYASLVDLRTGDIIWFNHSVTGDFREPEVARKSAQALLAGFPF